MKYEVKGAPMPVVECILNPEESMICDAGAMAYMSDNVEMKTSTNGGIKKVFSRMFSGETLFQNIYTAKEKEGMIAFASSFPGDIIPLDVDENHEYIIQKKAFLASTSEVKTEISFQKKLGVGFFGGEGFIMQRVYGRGKCFLEVDGSPISYQLKDGERMVVNSGYLVMMDSTCSIDIKSVGGVKNSLFGGEGFFNTIITGPGKIVIQTMPMVEIAKALIPFLPTNNKG